MIRTYFRIVSSNPPTESDFYSYERLGITTTRSTAHILRRRQGVSVYSSLERATRQAKQYPNLGSFIAVMEIDDERTAIEQTGREPEHFTIWAEPSELLQTITAIVDI
jgi:hypothetical protein